MTAVFTQCISAVFISAMMVYYLFFEPPFLSYENLPFPLESPVFHPGESVKFMVRRCNTAKQERVYVITRTLINLDTQERYVLPATTVSIMAGCTNSISAVNIVPLEASPGNYYVTGLAKVDGTIRTVYVLWESAKFRVEP